MIPAPQTKSVSREEFPEQAGWIDPLLRAINSLSEAIKGVAAAINAQGGAATLDLDVPATYTSAFPKLVSSPLAVKATHVYATAVSKRSDVSGTATSETRAVFVEWENSAAATGKLQLKIKNVSGLEVSTNYRITLRVEA